MKLSRQFMAEDVGRSESEGNCVQISSRLWKKRYQNAKTRFSVALPQKGKSVLSHDEKEHSVCL